MFTFKSIFSMQNIEKNVKNPNNAERLFDECPGVIGVKSDRQYGNSDFLKADQAWTDKAEKSLRKKQLGLRSLNGRNEIRKVETAKSRCKRSNKNKTIRK